MTAWWKLREQEWEVHRPHLQQVDHVQTSRLKTMPFFLYTVYRLSHRLPVTSLLYFPTIPLHVSQFSRGTLCVHLLSGRAPNCTIFSCVILPVISEPQTIETESVYPQDLCYVQLLIRFVCKMCVFFLHNSILSQYPLGSSGTSICNVSQAPAWQIWRLLIPCCSWHLRKSESRFLSIRVKN